MARKGIEQLQLTESPFLLISLAGSSPVMSWGGQLQQNHSMIVQFRICNT